MPDAAVDAAFGQALDAGYRHIDTARIYGNEEGVGRVLARDDVDRDDVFVTTKVWNDDHAQVPAAFDASMQRLGIEVLDLYLIHWPAPQQDAYVDAWRAMLEPPARGPGPLGRCLQLPGAPPAAAARRDRGPAVGQPGRA